MLSVEATQERTRRPELFRIPSPRLHWYHSDYFISALATRRADLEGGGNFRASDLNPWQLRVTSVQAWPLEIEFLVDTADGDLAAPSELALRLDAPP